jgi:hypothetical protein
MRIFRVVAGVLLVVLGLAGVGSGAYAAFVWIGSDDVIASRPFPVTSKGVAIVVPPDAITQYGPALHLTLAPKDANRGVFVGVGNELDVKSYLEKAAQAKADTVDFPNPVKISEVAGEKTSVQAARQEVHPRGDGGRRQGGNRRDGHDGRGVHGRVPDGTDRVRNRHRRGDRWCRTAARRAQAAAADRRR